MKITIKFIWNNEVTISMISRDWISKNMTTYNHEPYLINIHGQIIDINECREVKINQIKFTEDISFLMQKPKYNISINQDTTIRHIKEFLKKKNIEYQIEIL